MDDIFGGIGTGNVFGGPRDSELLEVTNQLRFDLPSHSILLLKEDEPFHRRIVGWLKITVADELFR